jgi:glutathione S-transferase
MMNYWCLLCAVLLSLIKCGTCSRQHLAFAGNKGGFPSLPNPFAPPPPTPEISKEENGRAVLKSLGLKSSTEPLAFYTDPERVVDITCAFMPFALRFGSGNFAEGYKFNVGPRDSSRYTVKTIGQGNQIVETCAIDAPPKLNRGPIILYEFEGCPFCRKVREAVSILSLEVEFRPCPQGSSFRKEIKDQYGDRSTFPFMRDPNTGLEMFESDNIIKYLFRTYGIGDVPSSLTADFVNTLSAGLGLLFRFGKGSTRRSSEPPELPLILWSSEGSPYAKLVKEELCELQIAHRQISCPRGSPQRQRMFEETGRFQIPYLEDPNNGVALYESSAIIEYLEAMYAVKKPSVEYI